MNTIIKQIPVDIYTPTFYEVIKAQQGDKNSRLVEFILFNQGEPYILPDNIIIKLEGQRANKSPIVKPCSFSNNTVTVELDEDLLYYHGICQLKIVIYKTDDHSILSTIPFTLSVQKNPLDSDAFEKDHYSLLNQLILETEIHAKKLDDEVKRATNTEEIITEQINHEISRAKSSEETLADNLADEVARATMEENNLNAIKSDIDHLHDDRYYTESEIDTKLGTKLDASLKGTANGIAELDVNGFVPSSQLPSFVSGDNITITSDTSENKITIASTHPSVTQSTDSTSKVTPSAGETFTAIDSLTRDCDGHITQINTKTVAMPSTSLNPIDLLDMVYPIGSIYMSVNDVSPSIFLGGIWESWGAGRVPVGVDNTQTEFTNVEQTGGNKNLQSHTHTIDHTHTMDHTHTIPAHAHGLNSHTHAIPALSGTAQSSGLHHHAAYIRSGIFSTGTSGKQTLGSASDYSSSWATATLDNGAHTHTVATNASTTGAASGNTANSATLTSGSASVSTTSTSSTANTGSSGSGNAQNLQPYITCFMWKRIA